MKQCKICVGCDGKQTAAFGNDCKIGEHKRHRANKTKNERKTLKSVSRGMLYTRSVSYKLMLNQLSKCQEEYQLLLERKKRNNLNG